MRLPQILASLLLLLALCSCKPVHDLAYFEDITVKDSGALAAARNQLVLTPEDELAITVNSEVPAASAHFNLPVADAVKGTDLQLNNTNRRLTYRVNAAGDIDFPSLGKIHVAGMTTTQLKQYLTERISREVKDPVVTVSLVNFRVNVIGEVTTPGVLEPKSERITLLEALAASGDLTQYGRRDNVLVLRENPDGTIQYGKVDLHSSQLTQSPYYYLQQNDVVYVTPNAIRQENSKFNQNNSYKLTVISTITSAVSVIASLVIALTVK